MYVFILVIANSIIILLWHCQTLVKCVFVRPFIFGIDQDGFGVGVGGDGSIRSYIANAGFFCRNSIISFHDDDDHSPLTLVT